MISFKTRRSGEQLLSERQNQKILDQCCDPYGFISGNLFENSPAGISIVQQGRIIITNKKTESITGYTIDELKTIDGFSIIHPEDRKTFRQYLMAKAGSDVAADSCHFRIVRKDGSTRWLERHIVNTEWNGAPAFLSFDIDITELKQAEAQLQLQAQLLDVATDAVYLRELDGKLVYANETIGNVIGYAKTEILNSNISRIVPTDEVQLISIRNKELLEKGKIDFEASLVHKNGSIIPVDIVAKIIEWNGQKLVMVAARDITEYKKAEKALRENEERLREAQALGKIANYEVDENTRDVIWSDEMYELFERDRELPPPSIEQIPAYFSEEEFVRFAQLTKTVFNEGKEVCGDIIAKMPSGKNPVFFITIRPIKNDKGQIIKTFGTIQDVTERKKVEQRITESEEKLKQSYDQLQKTFFGITQSFAATVELRDLYTAGHQKRVAELASAIAREMGLSEENVQHVYVAGLVHDIGKLSVPSEILAKPGELNEIEFALLKIHAQAGYEVLRNIDFPYPVARWVLEHHERLDGSGYPSGLTGDKISMEARILAVADVVEAISSHRPYRAALGIDQAIREIQINKTILYDEKVVDTCIHLFNEKKISL